MFGGRVLASRSRAMVENQGYGANCDDLSDAFRSPRILPLLVASATIDSKQVTYRFVCDFKLIRLRSAASCMGRIRLAVPRSIAVLE